MALLRREHYCRVCGMNTKARLGPAGIILWSLAVVLILFSFFFWPLIFIWPVLAVLLLLYLLGQTCQECGGPLERRGS
jgi:hypothetical protein